jgi:hypothetical protein
MHRGSLRLSARVSAASADPRRQREGRRTATDYAGKVLVKVDQVAGRALHRAAELFHAPADSPATTEVTALEVTLTDADRNAA